MPLSVSAADGIARIGGSWGFIIGFLVFLAAWVILNTVILATRSLDPYPFIFLNLLLSMLAAIQAPIIMMSQNRQAERDRFMAAKDYEINLKAEIEVLALHHKIDEQVLTELRENPSGNRRTSTGGRGPFKPVAQFLNLARKQETMMSNSMSGPRAIDHLVLPVTDLETSRERLSLLGFTVAADPAIPSARKMPASFRRRYLSRAAGCRQPRGLPVKQRARAMCSWRATRLSLRHGERPVRLIVKSDDAAADDQLYRDEG